MQDRASAWDAAPPKHREPDAEILEHERKRKVEVKCLELQLKLEDEGYVQLRSSRHMVDQLIAVIDWRRTRSRSRSTSFARSSLFSSFISSCDCFCAGQPITIPSESVALGLGITWKWTWSTS